MFRAFGPPAETLHKRQQQLLHQHHRPSIDDGGGGGGDGGEDDEGSKQKRRFSMFSLPHTTSHTLSSSSLYVRPVTGLFSRIKAKLTSRRGSMATATSVLETGVGEEGHYLSVLAPSSRCHSTVNIRQDDDISHEEELERHFTAFDSHGRASTASNQAVAASGGAAVAAAAGRRSSTSHFAIMRQRSQSVSTLPTHNKGKHQHLFKKNVLHAASRRTSPAVNSYNRLEGSSRRLSTSSCSVDQEQSEEYDDQHVQAMSHRDRKEDEDEEDVERAQHRHHHNSMAATPIRCQSPISQVEDQTDQPDESDQSEPAPQPPLPPPPPPAPQRRYRQRSHSLHPGLLEASLPGTSASSASSASAWTLASAHLSGYKKRLLSIGHLLLRRPSAPSLDSALSSSLDR